MKLQFLFSSRPSPHHWRFSCLNQAVSCGMLGRWVKKGEMTQRGRAESRRRRRRRRRRRTRRRRIMMMMMMMKKKKNYAKTGECSFQLREMLPTNIRLPSTSTARVLNSSLIWTVFPGVCCLYHEGVRERFNEDFELLLPCRSLSWEVRTKKEPRWGTSPFCNANSLQIALLPAKFRAADVAPLYARTCQLLIFEASSL